MPISEAEFLSLVHQTQLTTSSVQPKKFLARCIEKLDPEKLALLKNSYGNQSMVKLAILTANVVYAILTLSFTVALACLYLPTLGMKALGFPFVGGVAVGVATLFAGSFITPIENAVQQTKRKISKYEDLQKIYHDLESQHPTILKLTLWSMHIWQYFPGIPLSVNHPKNIKDLNPLIARAKYLEERIKFYIKCNQSANVEADRLNTQDPQANRQAIIKHERESIDSCDKGLSAIIKAAFVHAVLLKPGTTGTLNDLGSISKLTFEEHLLPNTTFFEFKDRNIAPITLGQVQAVRVDLLGRFLAAIVSR